MTLEQWMTTHAVTDEEVAARIGLDRSSVSRIRRGRQMPSPATMAAIARLTDGMVMPNDFFETGAHAA